MRHWKLFGSLNKRMLHENDQEIVGMAKKFCDCLICFLHVLSNHGFFVSELVGIISPCCSEGLLLKYSYSGSLGIQIWLVIQLLIKISHMTFGHSLGGVDKERTGNKSCSSGAPGSISFMANNGKKLEGHDHANDVDTNYE